MLRSLSYAPSAARMFLPSDLTKPLVDPDITRFFTLFRVVLGHSVATVWPLPEGPLAAPQQLSSKRRAFLLARPPQTRVLCRRLD